MVNMQALSPKNIAIFICVFGIACVMRAEGIGSELELTIGTTKGGLSVNVELLNKSSKVLWVLPWATPFEMPLLNDCFVINSMDGRKIDYIGIFARRSSPAMSDFIKIVPGDSLNASVDLARYYALSKGEFYTVSVDMAVAVKWSEPDGVGRDELVPISSNVIKLDPAKDGDKPTGSAR